MSYMSPFEKWQGQLKQKSNAGSANMNQSQFEKTHKKQEPVQNRTEPTNFEKYTPAPTGEVRGILKEWLEENGLKLGEAKHGYKTWEPPKKSHHGAQNNVK